MGKDYIVLDKNTENVVFIDRDKIKEELGREINYDLTHENYLYIKELIKRAEPYEPVEDSQAFGSRLCNRFRKVISKVVDPADLLPICKALDRKGIAYRVIMDKSDRYGVYTNR